MKKSSLILMNIFPVIGLVIWPFACFMTLFMFDAPGSANSLLNILLALSVWCYPVFVVLGCRIVLQGFKEQNKKRCMSGTLLCYGGLITFGLLCRCK